MCVILTNELEEDMVKIICHYVNVDLIVDSDGRLLSDNYVAIHIVELLCNEDVSRLDVA
jgi:hypothetical protein